MSPDSSFAEMGKGIRPLFTVMAISCDALSPLLGTASTTIESIRHSAVIFVEMASEAPEDLMN